MIVAKCPSGLRNCLQGSLIILAGVVVRTPASAAESWPALVNARYKLRFNGIDVGHLAFQSKTAGKTYSLTSSGEVSVLFGAVKWTGTSNVTGAIEASAPAPKSYAFDWQKNKKSNTFEDKRFGEHDAALPLEEKMWARLQKERSRMPRSGRSSAFNLDDAADDGDGTVPHIIYVRYQAPAPKLCFVCSHICRQTKTF